MALLLQIQFSSKTSLHTLKLKTWEANNIYVGCLFMCHNKSKYTDTGMLVPAFSLLRRALLQSQETEGEMSPLQSLVPNASYSIRSWVSNSKLH